MTLRLVKVLEKEEFIEIGFQNGSYYSFPIAHILNLKEFAGDNLLNPEVDLVNSKIYWRSKDYDPSKNFQSSNSTQSIILRALTIADVLTSIDAINSRFLMRENNPKEHVTYLLPPVKNNED